MRIEIAGQEIPVADVYFREWKFGRGTSNLPVLPYKMWVSGMEFIKALNEYYHDYAEDDKKFGMDADDIDLELRRMGWPTLSELISEHPQLLGQFIFKHCYDIIQALLVSADQLAPEYRFLVNTVGSVDVKQTYILFEGDVLKLA